MYLAETLAHSFGLISLVELLLMAVEGFWVNWRQSLRYKKFISVDLLHVLFVNVEYS